jgi:hypothetical protein
MTWVESHRESERLAAEAEVAAREGDRGRAQQLYGHAADAEDAALDALDLSKKRTFGVSAVSAVALRYKAAQYQEVEAACYKWLQISDLPDFAAAELKTVLQALKWVKQLRRVCEGN